MDKGGAEVLKICCFLIWVLITWICSLVKVHPVVYMIYALLNI